MELDVLFGSDAQRNVLFCARSVADGEAALQRRNVSLVLLNSGVVGNGRVQLGLVHLVLHAIGGHFGFDNVTIAGELDGLRARLIGGHSLLRAAFGAYLELRCHIGNHRAVVNRIAQIGLIKAEMQPCVVNFCGDPVRTLHYQRIGGVNGLAARRRLAVLNRPLGAGFQLRHVHRIGVFAACGYARDLAGARGITYGYGGQCGFPFLAVLCGSRFGCRIIAWHLLGTVGYRAVP